MGEIMGAQTKEESLESKSALLSKQVAGGQVISAIGIIRIAQYFASGGTLAAADPMLLLSAGELIVSVGEIAIGQLISFWRYSGDNKKLHIKKPKSNYTVSEFDN